MKLSKLKKSANNPRVIKDEKFELLKKSIEEFPDMMELRPIVTDKDNVILGGNMRYQALVDLGYKDIPDSWVIKASALTDDQKKRFMISDNVQFGEWDMEVLKIEWNEDELSGWGLDLIKAEESFAPEVNPMFDTSDVTEDEINKKAKLLADQMVQEMKKVDSICPKCGHEYSIQL
jgi:ParB-like chromosome segregation protein Spo0J